jgi:predicted acylesterase/phospholipase RssA
MTFSPGRILKYLCIGVLILLALSLVAKPKPFVVGKAASPPPVRSGPFGFRTQANNALCLSGGGYRAALFDVGAIWRLNELGALKNVDFVSSVSGGSLVGAYLVLHWRQLKFDPATDSAINFAEVIADPIVRMTSESIVAPALARSVLTGHAVAAEMASAYAKNLFGDARLKDLPDFASKESPAPRLVLNSTRLEDGNLWTFGQDGITAAHWPTEYQDLKLGDDRELPLAVAVAASAAFPPILSPLTLDVSAVLPSDDALRQHLRAQFPADDPDADVYVGKYIVALRKLSHRVSLVDGGVLNNGATEWCAGWQSTVTVSATVPTSIGPVGRSWPTILYKVLDDMYAAKEDSNAQRDLMGGGVMRPAPISINLQQAGYLSQYRGLVAALHHPPYPMAASEAERDLLIAQRKAAEGSVDAYARSSLRAAQLASVSTDLRALPTEDQDNLINLGYMTADLAILQRILYPAPAMPASSVPNLPTPKAVREVFPRAFSAPFKLPHAVPVCLQDSKVKCASGDDELFLRE